jgi:hypothetical protein
MKPSAPGWPAKGRQISFRSVLLGSVLAILLVSVGLVGLVSYANATLAVRKLSGHVLRQTSDRIREEIESLLERAVLVSRVNKNRYNSRELTYDDFDEITEHFYKSMGVLEELSYVTR